MNLFSGLTYKIPFLRRRNSKLQKDVTCKICYSNKSRNIQYVYKKKRVNYDIPFPRLNRTPPRISLWPSLSWSQTVNSRDRSQRASKEISSHAMVCSHFGQTVLRQTPVFCLPPLAFSGNKYLQWIK